MLVQPQIDTYSFDDDNFSLSSSENDVFFCFPLSRQYFSGTERMGAPFIGRIGIRSAFVTVSIKFCGSCLVAPNIIL